MNSNRLTEYILVGRKLNVLSRFHFSFKSETVGHFFNFYYYVIIIISTTFQTTRCAFIYDMKNKCRSL